MLSQKAFSDFPTKFEARHQYFPASFSVTLDSFNLLWVSMCLLTTLCKGKIERQSEAFTAPAKTHSNNMQTYILHTHLKEALHIGFYIYNIFFCVINLVSLFIVNKGDLLRSFLSPHSSTCFTAQKRSSFSPFKANFLLIGRSVCFHTSQRAISGKNCLKLNI